MKRERERERDEWIDALYLRLFVHLNRHKPVLLSDEHELLTMILPKVYDSGINIV
jgi:hypothetical protein